jgi:hypothetical protein
MSAANSVQNKRAPFDFSDGLLLLIAKMTVFVVGGRPCLQRLAASPWTSRHAIRLTIDELRLLIFDRKRLEIVDRR